MTILTIEEAAVLLKVSKWTVYRLVEHRQIPFIRLPSGTLRFKEESLEDWVAEHLVEAI